MKTKVIEDYRGTKSGPCLIIGNGPSLSDIPIDFINSIPNFGCNFLPLHAKGTQIDYLVMIDKVTMKSEKLWEWILPNTLVFCFARWAGVVKRDDRQVWWAKRDELMPGFSGSDLWGQFFPTSAHAAVWIGDVMGYDEFYLVGMDGTSQQKELAGTDGEGRSNVPHFYDNHPGKNSVLWDIAWGNMAYHLKERGKSITNLSTKTAITQIPRRDYLDFYEPNIGCWVWPEHHKRAGQVTVRASSLFHESVADAPPYITRALDRLGHLVVSTNDAGCVKIGRTDPSQSEDFALLQEYISGGRL